jgi:guanosine-3',5'-bis(diphosphate) 3'-pyrophosphohydrolase
MTSSRFLEGIKFATLKHGTMRRKAASHTVVPYMTHPIEVTQILVDVGVFDEDILLGGSLHDLLEDTDTTEEDILFKFGGRVLEIVKEVTDDKKMTREAQKLAQISAAHTKSYAAKLVKCADKISNNRDLIRYHPPKYTVQDFRDYANHSREVVAGLNANGEVPPQLLALFWKASQEVLDLASEMEFRAAQKTTAVDVKERT